MEAAGAVPVVLAERPPVTEGQQLIRTIEVERLVVAAAVQHHDVLGAVAIEIDHRGGVAAPGELARR